MRDEKIKTGLFSTHRLRKEMAYFLVSLSLSHFQLVWLFVVVLLLENEPTDAMDSIFDSPLFILWHWDLLNWSCFYFFSMSRRNSGADVERQSAARKAKLVCQVNIPDWTIPALVASITRPNRFASLTIEKESAVQLINPAPCHRVEMRVNCWYEKDILVNKSTRFSLKYWNMSPSRDSARRPRIIGHSWRPLMWPLESFFSYIYIFNSIVSIPPLC